MATTFEKLAEQAMALPTESRAQLADLLVESLAGDDPGRIEHLWLNEAKRRRDEVRSGSILLDAATNIEWSCHRQSVHFHI